MARPTKLEGLVLNAWLALHDSWTRDGDISISRTFKLADFSSALAFVVRVGMAAEKHDHHPDIELGWGRAKVTWSTHDAKGLTKLDLDLAEATESIFASMSQVK
ncbi:MAG: 4a-hydroxytetrahydrobiopterin dehydratase [Polyangiaceae bacterium]